MVASMADDAIVFAMANPTPEIFPDEARAARARVVGTGRSDFPNQVNNVIAFPGIFKGALQARAERITEPMKLAAAEALAALVSEEELTEEFIMPDPFDSRVADAVAAKALYGAPVIVVDFGTATNMEVVDADGRFIGGVIAPGVETSASALFSHATKLGAIDLVDPHTAIGHNTEEAIQAGIVYGEADRMDGIIRRIFAQLGYETPVVATGGLASRVAAQSQTITAINPELTLEGLRLVYEAQEGAASV